MKLFTIVLNMASLLAELAVCIHILVFLKIFAASLHMSINPAILAVRLLQIRILLAAFPAVASLITLLTIMTISSLLLPHFPIRPFIDLHSHFDLNQLIFISLFLYHPIFFCNFFFFFFEYGTGLIEFAKIKRCLFFDALHAVGLEVQLDDLGSQTIVEAHGETTTLWTHLRIKVVVLTRIFVGNLVVCHCRVSAIKNRRL